MQIRSIYITIAVAISIVIVIGIIAFEVIRINPKTSLLIRNSVSNSPTLTSVMDLCYMTAIYVDLEGGTYGGILKDLPVEEAQKLYPTGDKSTLATNRILWLYSYIPTSIDKEPDRFGDGWLKVIAKKDPNNVVSVTLIPKDLVNGIRHVRLVNVDDQFH